MPRSFLLTDALAAYVDQHHTPVTAVQRALVERTGQLGGAAQMQIGTDQGVFMMLVARMLPARRAIEVGTFTGYSALSVALGMPDDGRLLCCDVSDEWTSIGRRAWADAGVDHKIELRLGPAADTIRSLPLDPVFDLAFIDADKPNYGVYYDELVPRVRAGGVLLVDNMMWGGQVADPAADDENINAIRAVNDRIVADERVDSVLLTIGDGVMMAVKR